MFKKIKHNKRLFLQLSNLKNNKKYSNNCRPIKILGIETSCDDTGVAIVDDTGKIIGQGLCSQQKVHTR